MAKRKKLKVQPAWEKTGWRMEVNPSLSRPGWRRAGGIGAKSLVRTKIPSCSRASAAAGALLHHLSRLP